jgi:hypothetical protein
MALKAMETSQLPVGGKTTRGTGWGELVNMKVEYISKDNLLDYLITERASEEKEAKDLISKLSNAL